MMQSTSGGGQYAGVFDALSSIYNEGGTLDEFKLVLNKTHHVHPIHSSCLQSLYDMYFHYVGILGINALFVGSAARVAWLLPFTTIYLGVYEICKRR